MVHTPINHLGPCIGGAELVQENATAGMSQVALNYRNSSLSEDHSHGGAIRAGDRGPDMPVRLRSDGDWEETTLLSALDASHLTPAAALPDGATLPSRLKASVAASRFVEIAADAKAAPRSGTASSQCGD